MGAQERTHWEVIILYSFVLSFHLMAYTIIADNEIHEPNLDIWHTL